MFRCAFLTHFGIEFFFQLKSFCLRKKNVMFLKINVENLAGPKFFPIFFFLLKINYVFRNFPFV